MMLAPLGKVSEPHKMQIFRGQMRPSNYYGSKSHPAGRYSVLHYSNA